MLATFLRYWRSLSAALAGFAGAESGFAQNTSSVSSPGVDADDRSIEYRFGWVPEDDDEEARYAHRFDYGFSLNERQSLKFFANFGDDPEQDVRMDNLNVEYLIELSPESAGTWQTGIRFDGRITPGATADRIGVNWLNRWNIGEGTSVRAMLIATREVGSNADDAIAFEIRSSISRKLPGGYAIALLAFNDVGTSDSLGTGGQGQQLGPTISGPLGEGWTWTAGNLFGLSDSAPDNDVRLWLSRDF